jgi:hypothetical protein
MDVSDWTDEMSTCIKHRFQGAEVSVHSSSCSLTGFNVVVSLPPQRGWLELVGRAAAFVASLALFGAVWVATIAPSPPLEE